MRRRDFLAKGSHATLGLSLIPLAACSRLAQSKSEASLAGLVSDIRRQVPKWMDEARVPGASVVLIRNARRFWRGNFGVKDATLGTPVDNATIFEAASMSKPVFAYVVLKLSEKGVLDLDTPLTQYTPERYLEGDPRLDLITARHVLSHTSGFQDWRSAGEPLRIHFTPGEKFLYSGEGYSYLQSVVTRLTGRVDGADCATYEAGLKVCATDIDAFLKANLLIPFGMTSSGYVWNDRYETLCARPHDKDGKAFPKKKPRAVDAARYASAGGLHTTATEYAKFVSEILDPKPADDFRLKATTLAEMLRPAIKTDYPFPSSWALGWEIIHQPAGDLTQHGGDNDGFHSFAVLSLPRRSACVTMTNGDGGVEVIRKLFETRSMRAFLAA